ncbi:MAG TPA: hypothetical protein DCL44_04540 [Elusimicrobia bacterium]|nr:hypothetical protein [Elusimicrobiota bacterium]
MKRKISVAIVVGFISLHAVSAAYAQDAEQWHSIGDSYASSFQYENAMLAYRNAFELARKRQMGCDLPAHYALDYGKSAAFIGQYDKALDYYDRAISCFPDSEYLPGYVLRAGAYLDLGKYKKAISDYDTVIDLNPDWNQLPVSSSTAYGNRGSAYDGLKKYQEALDDYTRAIELDPANVLAYHRRGNLYYGLKQYDKAIADYNKTIDLNPLDVVGVYCRRGDAYKDLKKYDKAMADYTKAIKLIPECVSCSKDLGIMYHALGKPDKAKEDIATAVSGYSRSLGSSDTLKIPSLTVDAYDGRGWAYLWLGKCEEAKIDLEKAIGIKDSNPHLYIGLGAYWWTCHQDKKQALKYLKNGFKIGMTPRDLDALYDDTSDGHFFKDFNNTPEFKELFEKYRKK